ncbi:MAG TPA: hypothetical protein VNO84_04565 [Burkholderiaceae bacterium]|nr:hypothetical protein [Burkholderiaceae bacterium]
MSKIRMSIAAAAASLMALTGTAYAQSANTDERTSQSEMQRGVPGVDVDTGRRADGAIDVDTNRSEGARTQRSETDRGVPGVDVDTGRNAQGAVDVDTTRAPRADRN